MDSNTPPLKVPSHVNMAGKISINSSKLIIVEGKDEETCFRHWLKRWDFSDIQVLAAGGKTQIPMTVDLLRDLPNFSTLSHLLIVRDADDTPMGAFESVRSALNQAKYMAPLNAWIWEKPQYKDPALCVAILPSISQEGALEELLLQTVADDGVLKLTEDYIEAAYRYRKANFYSPKLDSIVPPSEVHRGKATALAYMVTRVADMREVGRAAQKDVWDCQHPVLEPLKSIIEQMNQ